MPKKLTIEEMHRLAKERGGKCLSKRYVNNSTDLQWECAEGHRWPASPGNVKSGKWCKICGYAIAGKHRRLTIEEMHQLAKERGGKCLSKRYVNNRTDLQWECAEGHRWPANPGNVKSGKWCKSCAIKKRRKRR